MNRQQARIEAHLDGLRNLRSFGDIEAVDLVNQTALLAEGYDLRALDADFEQDPLG